MGEYIEPFNLEKLFINYFAGGTFIFSVLLLLFLTYFAAKFGMTLRVYLSLLSVASIIMAFWMGIWYFFVLMLVGFVLFKVIAKLTQ